MSPSTQSATRRRSGTLAAQCLEHLCRDYRKQRVLQDPLSRVSREAARILNLAGVELDPDLTISEQAAAAARRGETWGVALCRLLDTVDPGHCARLPDVMTTRDVVGITPGMRGELLTFRERSLAAGLPDPLERIISGYRTPREQIGLLSRWIQGDRAGIAVKPGAVENSRHVRGTAVDLRGTNDELTRWARIWEGMGHRWGGRFFPRPDLPHFDLG